MATDPATGLLLGQLPREWAWRILSRYSQLPLEITWAIRVKLKLKHFTVLVMAGVVPVREICEQCRYLLCDLLFILGLSCLFSYFVIQPAPIFRVFRSATFPPSPQI